MENNHHHILVVDDSVETLRVVKYTLERVDFKAVLAGSGEEALQVIGKQGLPQLAIVDLNMPPGMDGFTLCRKVQQFSDLPVILLTAVDESEKIVKGIEQYAEDYIIKPFNPDELVARVRRVLQRIGTFPYSMTRTIDVDGHLVVSFAERAVTVEDVTRSLTPTESKLLYVLLRSVGETVNTDYILRRLWPMEIALEDRLHVHVHRLRQKLATTEIDHQYVVSERGVGYRLEPVSGEG